MTTTVLLQFDCDAEGCDRRIRTSHWSALGAQSEARRAMRLAGWTVAESLEQGNRSNRRHYCAEHAGRPWCTRFDHGGTLRQLRDSWTKGGRL